MSTKIASSSLTIGIDIGGTKVLGGVVDASGKIIESARRVTPAAGGKELIATIVELIKELNSKHEIAGIGICVAALISADQGTIVGAPNIANWSPFFAASVRISPVKLLIPPAASSKALPAIGSAVIASFA